MTAALLIAVVPITSQDADMTSHRPRLLTVDAARVADVANIEEMDEEGTGRRLPVSYLMLQLCIERIAGCIEVRADANRID